MNAQPPDGKRTTASTLLVSVVLGLLVCPLVYLALGARGAFPAVLYVITTPPLVASLCYLGLRYLRPSAMKPSMKPSWKTLHVLGELASWLVVGAFLLIVAGINLLTPFERLGFFFCLHLPASMLCLPVAIWRETALGERISRLPPRATRAALVLVLALEIAIAVIYLLRPARFI